MIEINALIVKLWARKLRGFSIVNRERLAGILERAAFTIANLEDRVKSTKESAGRVIAFLNQQLEDNERGHRESYTLVERDLLRVNAEVLRLERVVRTLTDQNADLHGENEDVQAKLDAALRALDDLRRWRINVTSALGRSGGIAYMDVPAAVKALATERPAALREALDIARATNRKQVAVLDEQRAEIASLREKNSKLEAQYLEVGKSTNRALAQLGEPISGTLPELFRAYVDECDRRHNRQANRLREQQIEIKDLQSQIELWRGRVETSNARFNEMAEEHKSFERLAASEGSAQLEVSNLKARLARIAGIAERAER